MVYHPVTAPSNPAQLPAYLEAELKRLQQELSSPQDIMRLAPTYVAPDKPREGDIRYADGTNWNPDGAGEGPHIYMNGTWEPLFRSWTYNTPASVTVTTGGTATGTVAGVQEWNDGSEYSVLEVAGTPGFDIRFNFTGLTSIRYISSQIKYDGSTSHDVELQIYNYTDTTWETITHIPDGDAYNLRFVGLPADDADYISSGAAILRAYHVTGGVPSHTIYFDFISLVC